MSLTADLRGGLRKSEILIENKHMKPTDTQQASTPDADICGDLRTNCGQAPHLHHYENALVAIVSTLGSGAWTAMTGLRIHDVECGHWSRTETGWQHWWTDETKGIHVDLPTTPPAERPTPITDAVWRKHTGFSPQSAADAYELAGNLERQLAEAREQRNHYLAESNQLAEELKQERGASFREQRDRLARALNEIRDKLHNDKRTDWRSEVYHIEKALAAVKGGPQ